MTPDRPAISVVFVIAGIIGLLGSLFFLMSTLSSSGAAGDMLVASAFSGIFGSLLCFAVSYALARLNEIASYQRQALLLQQQIPVQAQSPPASPVAPVSQNTVSVSTPFSLAGGQSEGASGPNLGILIGVLILIIIAVVLIAKINSSAP